MPPSRPSWRRCPGRSFRTGESVALEDVREASGFEYSNLLREHDIV
jgi:hypothetical protein